jgi:microsomal dipeptidase-like Zn-dependent dipeptidase
MLVDLHAHYPMHLIPAGEGHAHAPLHGWRSERWRARFVDLLSRFANYEGPGDEPSVTVELLREGDVGVALSVLYSPFDEIDLTLRYASPPKTDYIDHLLDQIDLVEQDIADRPDATVVRSRAELDAALAAGTLALVHCIEGGFALGASEAEVRANVSRLAQRGVAYVTLAHLFWRQVATNAPALPFLPDWLYRLVFPQPSAKGLGDLGRAALEAMLAERVLVDVTHMGDASLRETLDVLDERDPAQAVPVIASHGAYRFGNLNYNLTGEAIERIARRGGVIGLIVCRHYISNGLKPKDPKSFDDSVALLCEHVDRIAALTGSLDNVGIGSDLDGYIKPALPGLEHMGRMAQLQQSLRDRYGPSDAEKLCSGNALRMLRHRFTPV